MGRMTVVVRVYVVHFEDAKARNQKSENGVLHSMLYDTLGIYTLSSSIIAAFP
jgi:hypothetical protein